jgi:hypothetical protein
MARMPVALSMLVVGSAGYVYFVGLPSFLNFLNATPYYLFANYTLSVIPLFVLMGAFAERSGLARDLFALCSILVGRMRGGLGISVIGACSIFGAICGSSLATTATFSRAALPEMKRLRRAIENVGRPISQHRRVAVGRGGSDAADPDCAGSAGHVLDDDRLAEWLAHALGHDAADGICRPASSERHDQCDHPRRIRLCPCSCDRSQCERKCERELLSHAGFT